ncbi:hypothetical protein D770_10250 [Flammeovirgaceae bacterium 311]|nr:hypothetical protein D770_10250 [Flammeovirgaceae bacterium 311]
MKAVSLIFTLLISISALGQTMVSPKIEPLRNYKKEKEQVYYIEDDAKTDAERKGEIYYYDGKNIKAFKSFAQAEVTEDETHPLYDLSQQALFKASRAGFKLYGGATYIVPLNYQDYNSNFFAPGIIQEKKGADAQNAFSDVLGFSYGLRAHYALWPYKTKKQPYHYKPAVTLFANYSKELPVSLQYAFQEDVIRGPRVYDYTNISLVTREATWLEAGVLLRNWLGLSYVRRGLDYTILQQNVVKGGEYDVGGGDLGEAPLPVALNYTMNTGALFLGNLRTGGIKATAGLAKNGDQSRLFYYRGELEYNLSRKSNVFHMRICGYFESITPLTEEDVSAGTTTYAFMKEQRAGVSLLVGLGK